MKKRAFAILLLLCLPSCDRLPDRQESHYQLMKAADGSVYRLNKKTGQVSVIKGDEIVAIKAANPVPEIKYAEINPEKEQPEEGPQNISQAKTPEPADNVQVDYAIKNMKDWSEQRLQGKNLKVRFKSAWKKGVLDYEFVAYPYLSLKKMLDKKEEDVYYQRKWHGFVINLIDEEGVIINIIPIKLWDMARTVDNKGRFESMVIKDKIELPEDEYIRIIDYNLDWKLDRLFIPDYKFQNKVDDLMQTYSWYGEVDRKVDIDAPQGAKYWWMTFPDKRKVYFSTEQELLKSYQETTGKIIDSHKE
ncbi:MAG: hypothetical protein L6416_07895 [Candidatus Omnitrophica bacterium]|nr:hypothetical protein [Candidatus Omnitrophota bacterium]